MSTAGLLEEEKHATAVELIPAMYCSGCQLVAACPHYSPAKDATCHYESGNGLADDPAEILRHKLMMDFARYRRETTLAALEGQADPRRNIALTAMSREITRTVAALARMTEKPRDPLHLHLHQEQQILQFVQQSLPELKRMNEEIQLLTAAPVKETILTLRSPNREHLEAVP